jgi:hypothetical protein
MNKDLLDIEIQSYLLQFALEIMAWQKEEVKVPDNTPQKIAKKYALIIERLVGVHGK